MPTLTELRQGVLPSEGEEIAIVYMSGGGDFIGTVMRDINNRVGRTCDFVLDHEEVTFTQIVESEGTRRELYGYFVRTFEPDEQGRNPSCTAELLI